MMLLQESEVEKLLELVDGLGLAGIERRVALFRSIVIETSPFKTIEDRLLKLYRETRMDRVMYHEKVARGIPAVRPDCWILPIVGESHCGKSTAVEHFASVVLPRAPVERGSMPMVLVSLTEEATIKQMWIDVLRGFGDPSLNGTRHTVENRVEKLAIQHSTEIVAIDECQHLIARQGQLADALKKAVQRSQFSLVLIGQPKDIRSILNDRQVANRCLPEIELVRHNSASVEGRKRFTTFLAQLDAAMVKLGIFAEDTGFHTGQYWKQVMIASDGLVGVASKIINLAISDYCEPSARKLDPETFARAAEDFNRTRRLGRPDRAA